MCLLTLLLFATGTVQDFVDSTQLSLLSFYVIMGIFLVFFSTFGMFLDIRRFLLRKKKRYLLRAGGYLLLVIFGLATVLLVIFIVFISKGNGAE
jgi:hypothetical protein